MKGAKDVEVGIQICDAAVYLQRGGWATLSRESFIAGWVLVVLLHELSVLDEVEDVEGEYSS